MKTILLTLLIALEIFGQEVYIVKEQLHDRYFINDGRVEAINRAKISAQTNGVVTYLASDIADTFKKGDTLLKISSISQSAKVEEARFEVENAILKRNEKKIQYERIKVLDAKKLAKDEDVTAAESAYKISEKTISLKKQKLAHLEEVYSYTIIKAPFDGIVENRYVENSEKVTINTPLFDVYNNKKMRVIVVVPESLIPKIRMYKQVSITVNKKSYPIDYKNIIIFPTSYNYSYTIRINIPHKISSLFHDGNFVNVRFKIDEERTIFVKNKYVHQAYEATIAYVKDANRTYSQFLRLGKTNDDEIEILSGLSNGDSLVEHE